MNNIIELTREVNWYRPYFINNKYVQSIVIYKDNEILFSTNAGWFEACKEERLNDLKKVYEYCFLNDIISLKIEEPKKANKLNLLRSDNFYMSTKSYNEVRYILYLNADLLKFEFLFESKKEYDDGQTHIYKICKIIDANNNIFYISQFKESQYNKKYFKNESLAEELNKLLNTNIFYYNNAEVIENYFKEKFNIK